MVVQKKNSYKKEKSQCRPKKGRGRKELLGKK